MTKAKKIFKTKEEISLYEGLVLAWPCVDKISGEVIDLLKEQDQATLAQGIQFSIQKYHEQFPFYMTDWERLAIFVICLSNFASQNSKQEMTFENLINKLSLPRHLTTVFIEETARKTALEIENA